MDVKYYHYSHFPDGNWGLEGPRSLYSQWDPGSQHPTVHPAPSGPQSPVPHPIQTGSETGISTFSFPPVPLKHPSFQNSRGLSGGARQTLCRRPGAGRVLRIAACPACPQCPAIWPQPGITATPAGPPPPAGEIYGSQACAVGLGDMVLQRSPAMSLPPSATWLPEGPLANVCINDPSAPMANSLISYKTAWNSAPRTVLREEGAEVMGKCVPHLLPSLPKT